MLPKKSNDTQRLQRYAQRISRLLGQEEKSFATPWKIGPPKRIRTQGPMVQRIDTFIKYEQNLIILNRVIGLRIHNLQSIALSKMKQYVSLLSNFRQMPPVLRFVQKHQQLKQKHDIVLFRVRNLVNEKIRQCFLQIINSNSSNNHIKNDRTKITIQHQEIRLKASTSMYSKRIALLSISNIFDIRLQSSYLMIVKQSTNKTKVKKDEIKIQDEEQEVFSFNSPEKLNVNTSVNTNSNKLAMLTTLFLQMQKQLLISSLYTTFSLSHNFTKKNKTKKQLNLLKKKMLFRKLNSLFSNKSSYYLILAFNKILNHKDESFLFLTPQRNSPQPINKLTRSPFKSKVQTFSKLMDPLERILRSYLEQSFVNIQRVKNRIIEIELGTKIIEKVLKKNAIFNIKNIIQQQKYQYFIKQGLQIINKIIHLKTFDYFNKIIASFTSEKMKLSLTNQPTLQKNKCGIQFSLNLNNIYLKHLSVAFWKIFITNNDNFEGKQSTSSFIYDQILDFLDKQNKLSLDLNRHCDRIQQTLGGNSSIRVYDSQDSVQKIKSIRDSLK